MGVITRRMFVGGAASFCAAKKYLVLEAIAAEKLPHRILVRGVARAPFFELRDYGSAEVAGILRRHGIRFWESNGKILFAFESLEERERAWREVSGDLACSGLREIAVYRTV